MPNRQNIPISEKANYELYQLTSDHRTKIYQSESLTEQNKQEHLEYLNELAKCSIGQYLLINQRLNSYWLNYVQNFPFQGKKTRLNNLDTPLTSMECFLLEASPYFLAIQENAATLSKTLEELCKNYQKIASIPCGLMDNLFSIAQNQHPQALSFYGFDPEPLNLQLSKQTAKKMGLSTQVELYHKSPFELKTFAEFEIILGNDIAIYLSDDKMLLKLLQRYYDALLPDGKLLLTTITPPPINGFNCEWNFQCIDAGALVKQSIIFNDILEVKWQNYRSSEQMTLLMKQVGFKIEGILFDKAKMLPIIVANK